MSRVCHVYYLGRVTYERASELQRSLVKGRKENQELPDILLLLEHLPIYTLGTGATLEHLKFELVDPPYPVYRSERGGEVTHHCPGQLVGYPILNLNYYQKDLHWYLRQLEEVIIQLVKTYGLSATRSPGLTGVWLEGYKIAAIGIKVSQWITMHGFALNVTADLTGFTHIVPCGLLNHPVGNLAQFLPEVNIAQVQVDLIKSFEEIFAVECLINPGLILSE